MDWQSVVVILIGILVAGIILRRIVRTARCKDPNLCAGCPQKKCPRCNDNKREEES